eukprot:TRINITY_DN6570_c0_g1_i2.p1 TRINITY_DN6570_c0_g1~~TRINITY_DN6570_c0_g1_i2.p1  ORF type:complete len:454 (+),score=89.02 TRINITY_DN6570_c0_g1_i2:165-1364(+)
MMNQLRLKWSLAASGGNLPESPGFLPAPHRPCAPLEVVVRCPCSGANLRVALLAQFFRLVVANEVSRELYSPRGGQAEKRKVERNKRICQEYVYLDNGRVYDNTEMDNEDADEWVKLLYRHYDVKVRLPSDAPGYVKAKTRDLLMKCHLSESFFEVLGDGVIELAFIQKRDTKFDEELTAKVNPPPSPVQASFSRPYLVAGHPSVMTVTVPENWRVSQGLSHRDITTACMEAKCYHPDTLRELRCNKCATAKKSDCTIRITMKCNTAPDAQQKDAFFFNATSVCSSSRVHMKSPQVVVGFMLRNGLEVYSTPIELRSRSTTVDSSNKPHKTRISDEITTLTASTPSPPLDSSIPSPKLGFPFYPLVISVRLFKHSVFFSAPRAIKCVLAGLKTIQVRRS